MYKTYTLKDERKHDLKLKLPDTFLAFIAQNQVTKLDIHFGANYDLIVVVPHNKQLSKDDQERIRILTEVKH